MLRHLPFPAPRLCTRLWSRNSLQRGQVGRRGGGEAVIARPQAWEGLGNPAVMVSLLWVGLLQWGSSHPDLALPFCLPLPSASRLWSLLVAPDSVHRPPCCLLSPLLYAFSSCGWLSSCASPSLGCTPPRPVCPLCLSSFESVCLLLLVSTSLFISSCFLPPFASVSLPALPLPSHPWIPAVPFSLPSPDPHCPPPSLPGPTLLDMLPPVALEATSPSIFSSRRS